MNRNMRWMLPVTAAVGLLVGMSALSARAADDEKPAGKGTISGTVLDKDGKGVADVKVQLMKPMMRRGGGGPGGEDKKPKDQVSEGQQATRLQAEGKRPQRPEPVATAMTDADGKFEMKDVPAGDYMIGVRDQEKKVYGGTRVTVKDGETATVEIKTSDKPMRGRGGHGGAGGAGGGTGGGETK